MSRHCGTSGRNRSTRRSLTPEQRAERLSAARQQLLDGIDALMTSDGWRQLITSRKWLRRYSINNLLMILQQCPEATDVRPLSEWKQAGYGYTRKGTHQIKIWAPRFRRITPDTNLDQQDTTETIPADGTREQSTALLSGFLLVPVIDVSQLQVADKVLGQLDHAAPADGSDTAPAATVAVA